MIRWDGCCKALPAEMFCSVLEIQLPHPAFSAVTTAYSRDLQQPVQKVLAVQLISSKVQGSAEATKPGIFQGDRRFPGTRESLCHIWTTFWQLVRLFYILRWILSKPLLSASLFHFVQVNPIHPHSQVDGHPESMRHLSPCLHTAASHWQLSLT